MSLKSTLNDVFSAKIMQEQQAADPIIMKIPMYRWKTMGNQPAYRIGMDGIVQATNWFGN